MASQSAAQATSRCCWPLCRVGGLLRGVSFLHGWVLCCAQCMGCCPPAVLPFLPAELPLQSQASCHPPYRAVHAVQVLTRQAGRLCGWRGAHASGCCRCANYHLAASNHVQRHVRSQHGALLRLSTVHAPGTRLTSPPHRPFNSLH